MGKFTDFGESATDNLFSHFKVIGRLQVYPVLGRLSKRLSEKQGHLSANGPFALDHMGYPHGRKTDGAGKLGPGNAQFIQNLFQEFTGMNLGQIILPVYCFNSLMIIGYL
jgi:hypothetical protein